MTARQPLYVLCAILLCLPGCDTDPPAPPASTARVIPGPASSPEPGLARGAPPGAGADVGPHDALAGRGAGLAASSTFPIRISAGTSLPQTGPEGVLMGFSVDYKAQGYQLPSGARCVLVIERGDGKRVEQPAEISAGGTWALLVPGWPPEAGPFQARVEEISAE